MSAAMTVDDSIPALLVILDGLGDMFPSVLGGRPRASVPTGPCSGCLTCLFPDERS